MCETVHVVSVFLCFSLCFSVIPLLSERPQGEVGAQVQRICSSNVNAVTDTAATTTTTAAATTTSAFAKILSRGVATNLPRDASTGWTLSSSSLSQRITLVGFSNFLRRPEARCHQHVPCVHVRGWIQTDAVRIAGVVTAVVVVVADDDGKDAELQSLHTRRCWCYCCWLGLWWWWEGREGGGVVSFTLWRLRYFREMSSDSGRFFFTRCIEARLHTTQRKTER